MQVSDEEYLTFRETKLWNCRYLRHRNFCFRPFLVRICNKASSQDMPTASSRETGMVKSPLRRQEGVTSRSTRKLHRAGSLIVHAKSRAPAIFSCLREQRDYAPSSSHEPQKTRRGNEGTRVFQSKAATGTHRPERPSGNGLVLGHL